MCPHNMVEVAVGKVEVAASLAPSLPLSVALVAALVAAAAVGTASRLWTAPSKMKHQ